MKTTLASSAVSGADHRNHRNPNSRVIKRSIKLAGNKTSVSLEEQFWDGLHEIARSENIPTCALIERIDTNRGGHNLSSAIRLFVLGHFRGGSDKAPLIPTDALQRSPSGAL